MSGPDAPPARPPVTARVLRAMNPASLLFGAIFQRDARVLGRRRSTYLIRGLYALGLVGILSLAFVSSLVDAGSATGSAGVQQLQRIAPGVTISVVWFQAFGLCLAAPWLTAGVIAGERRGRTLGALMTTPLSPWQIVGSSLASRYAEVLILALMSTPVLLAVRVFGGVPIQAVVGAVTITLATSLLAGALGVLYSVRSARPARAAAGAMGTLTIIEIAPPVLMMALAFGFGGPPTMLIFWVASAPFALMMVSAELSGERMPLPFASESVWMGCAAVHVAGALLCAVLAALLLRRSLVAEAAGVTALAPTRREKRAARIEAQRAKYLARRSAQLPPRTASATTTSASPAAAPAEAPHAPPAARPRPPAKEPARSRSVGDRPVLWRELRQAAFKNWHTPALGGLAIALLAAWVYWQVGLDEPATHFVAGVIGVIVLLGQAAGATTASVTSEREGQTWETLLTTPLPAGQILAAKMLGGLRRLWPVPALLALHFGVVGTISGGVHPIVLLHLLLIMLGGATLLCGTGVLLSLRARRTTTASVLNLGLGLTLWLGLPFVLAIASPVLRLLLGDAEWLGAGVLISNPVVMSVIAIEPAAAVGFDRHAIANLSHMDYEIGLWDPGVFGFTMTCTAFALVGVILGWGAVVLAAARMDRWGPRSS